MSTAEGNVVTIRDRLAERGLDLPPAQIVPDGMAFSYRRLVRHGDVAYLSGHGPSDGPGWGSPLGKVGASVSVEQAIDAARLTGLNLLGTIERELGDLDLVTGWLKVNGFVNCGPEFVDHAQVINGCTDLIRDLFGAERLAARTSIGVPSLPFDMPVEVDAVILLDPRGRP